jgi:hypothetical protein
VPAEDQRFPTPGSLVPQVPLSRLTSATGS